MPLHELVLLQSVDRSSAYAVESTVYVSTQRITFDAIMLRIRHKSYIHECTREPANGRGNVSDGPQANLCVEMLYQVEMQSSLVSITCGCIMNENRPALQYFLTGHHLLIAVNVLQLCHDDSNGTVVKLRPACTSNHLQDFGIRELLRCSTALIKSSSAFDDDHMAWQVDTHSQCRGAADGTKLSRQICAFDRSSVFRNKSSMMDGYAVGY